MDFSEKTWACFQRTAPTIGLKGLVPLYVSSKTDVEIKNWEQVINSRGDDLRKH